jgi:hypothetical protein
MKIILVLLLLPLVFSCKKGTGNFIIKGEITDETFSTGLDGAIIKLYKVPVASSSRILVESFSIQEDGNYSFTFPRERMEKYILVIEKNLYFKLEKEIYYSDLTVNEPLIRNYGTKAKSWVELRFVNAVVQPSDHFRFIKQDGLVGCDECCSNTEENIYANPYFSKICINNANELYSILYWNIGTLQQGYNEVITTPFDTTLLLINY